MKFTTKTIMAAAVGLALSSGIAFAGPADDAVNGRQGCMKANGGAMGVFVPMAKGEKPFDAAAVTEAIGKVEAACAGWGGWWSADHKQGETVKSYAKDAVWTDAANFALAGEAYVGAIGGLKLVPDEAAFKTAFGALGKTCQGCHELFRAPKE